MGCLLRSHEVESLLLRPLEPCGLALQAAAAREHLACLQLLFEASTELPLEAALQAAAEHGRSEALRLLLASGADPEALTEHGLTPLRLAALNGHLQVARLLLEAGAEREKASGAGATPLLLAALNGHVEVARLLLEHGAEQLGSLFSTRF